MIFVCEAWNVKKSAFGTDRSTEERRKTRKWEREDKQQGGMTRKRKTEKRKREQGREYKEKRTREDKEEGKTTRMREIEQGREDNGEGTRKMDRGQGGDICNIVPRTSSS